MKSLVVNLSVQSKSISAAPGRRIGPDRPVEMDRGYAPETRGLLAFNYILAHGCVAIETITVYELETLAKLQIRRWDGRSAIRYVDTRHLP